MKTFFTIPAGSLGTLNRYAGLISKMSDITNKQFLIVSDKKLVVFVSGKQSVLTFEVDIEGYSSDKDEDYIALNYDKFITTSNKITNNDSLSVTIDDGGVKLLLKSTTSKSKVTLSCFDQTSDLEVDAVKKEYEELYNTYFIKNTKKVKLTKGLMEFAKVSGKFMKLTAKSNSVLVGKNTVKYADNTSIVVYTDKELLLESPKANDELIVHTLVLDLVASLGKAENSIVYSEDGQFAFFEYTSDTSSLESLKFIINVPSVLFDFPSPSEEESISPESDKQIKIVFNRSSFLTSLNVFDGIFDSIIWKWKPLKFTFTEESAKANQINLSHSDSNAEAERDCDIVSYENTTGVDKASFIFSSEFYKKVLEFGQAMFKNNAKTDSKADATPDATDATGNVVVIPAEDTITLCFSNASLEEAHGLGVVVSSEDGTLKAIFAKFQE